MQGAMSDGHRALFRESAMQEQKTALSDGIQFVQFWLTRAKASYPADPAEARKCLEETDQYVRDFAASDTGTHEQWLKERPLRCEALRLWIHLFREKEEFLRRMRQDDWYEWLLYAKC